MLTSLNIQVAIIKAFYALAKKSVKYYTGLALGKNNTCLFKEIRLLRAYVEILKNFKIVGSTITCCCSVEGDYTVLLNEDLSVTNTPIQFGCDNQGYMVFNNIGYTFTYWYDEPNSEIVIQFISDAPNPNLITNNPNFATNLDDWNIDKFNWSGYGGIGSALYNGGTSGGFLSQPDVLEIGKTYTVTFDIITEYFGGVNDNTVKVVAGTQEAVIFQGSITNSEVITVSTTVTCFGNTDFEINVLSDADSNETTFNLYITKVDVREVIDTTITVTDVAFTDTCNITGNAVSPIEVAEMRVISNRAITVNNAYGVWNGNISILIGSTVVFTSAPIPALIMDNPIAIVSWWALPGNGIADWILLYDQGEFVLYSPFNNVDYSQYTAQFNQYEGGSDSFVDFDLSGLPPFVTVNTPSYVDILFQQDTFIASNEATTSITLPSGRLPYLATANPASVNLVINQFALGQPATMSIPLSALFNSTAQDFYYLGMPMFNHIGSYTDMTELINDFNLNNGQGFTASDGGTLPIPGEVLATASNTPTFFNTAAFGDVYTARLVNVPLGGISTTIGTYTVGDDSAADIANFIAADIIAQGIYQGTVSVTGTVITLTAPLGTGDSWNYDPGVSTYAFSIQKTGDRAILYYFNGGVAPPTIPIHILNITALDIYPQTDYDGGIIEIRYPIESYQKEDGQFAGAVDDISGQVTFYDSYSLTNIYQSPLNTLFTSVQEMIDDFNSFNTLGAVGTVSGNNVNIVMPMPPAWGYNGNTLTYTFDPSTGRNYVNVGTYFGGADTTEATYILVILDGGNNPFRVITDTSTFINLQSIVNNLNSQPTFNSDFIASLSGTNLVITTLDVPLGAAFNNYSFQLFINYTSLQYAASDFTSTIGLMSGGINRVAPNITLENDYTSTLIYTLAQDSYNYDGINDFVNQFNIDSPFNYSATSLGPIQSTPEILSQSLLNLPKLSVIPNTVLKTYYQSISPPQPPVLIGTFTPILSTDYTGAGLAAGLASAINLNPWTGTASNIASTLKLLSPSGTFGSYNNDITVITRTVPTLRAVTNVTITQGSSGSATLELTVLTPTPVSLGIQTIPVAQTAQEWALAYRDRINLGTGTHGYSAVVGGQLANRIIISAPAGTSANGDTISVTQATGGIIIITTPTPTFNGGTDTTDNLVIGGFSGGGLTLYDKVRFTADPSIYTWEYSDAAGTFTYTNLSVIPNYINTGTFLGGNDNTAGQLYLELSKTSLPTNLWVLYQNPTAFNYTSFQQWENFINGSSTNLDFSALSAGTDFTINSPEDSFAYFNTDYDLFLSYTYASPQWTSYNYGQLYTITNGVDPVLTPYEGDFTAGVLGDFINSDPCTTSTVTQTCLTNSQISKIMTHIDKLVK
jgi:hypothetical protein